MLVIEGRNVHELLPEALHQLKSHGVERGSRNGPVIMFPYPTTIVYGAPTERVMFWKERDANPFFHFMECLWMISGRNDVKWIEPYAGALARYSDDGIKFHGAYGHRWRKHFLKDQIFRAIDILSKDKDSRRVYIQMWDARADLDEEGKDFPCNVGLTLQINQLGGLDMVVHNRSNDLIWGALGANAVHFSFMQEYVASALNIPIGLYWQVSSNLHAYKEVHAKIADLADEAEDTFRAYKNNPYMSGEVEPFPIMTTPQATWDQDLGIFMKEGPIVGFRDPFFRKVATPMWVAHKAYRDKTDPDRHLRAIDIMQQCGASDWKKACIEWLERRFQSHVEKNKNED